MTTYTSAQPAYRAPAQTYTDSAVLVQALCNGKSVTNLLSFSHIHEARMFLTGKGAHLAQQATAHQDETWISGTGNYPITWKVLR